MTRCIVCNSSSFQLINGTFFCTECQTGSQDLREENNEEFQTLSTSQYSLKINNPKCIDNRKKGKEIDFGVQWTTNDAFNIILKELVEVLIQFGISSELKIVVKHLWFLFLKKTEYAFCKSFSDKSWTPKLPTFPRERDVQTIYHDASEIVATKFRQRYLKAVKQKLRKNKSKRLCSIASNRRRQKRNQDPKKKSNRKRSRNEPSLEVTNPPDNRDNLKEETVIELHDGDKENGSCDKGKIEEDEHFVDVANDANKEDRSDVFIKPKRKPYNTVDKKFKKSSHISRVTMARILEFLYLGLLLVDECVLLSDILRWIKESSLPLREAVKFLPDEMKFQTYDSNYFRLLIIPTTTRIRLETAGLARFLGIHTIPSKNIHEIAARFLLELNLPEEFHRLINNLILMNPPLMPCSTNARKRLTPVPNYEGRALAYIIVTLKLLLGLDGRTEYKQSKFGKEIASIFEDENPFIWDNWVLFINGRRRMLKMHFTDLNLE